MSTKVFIKAPIKSQLGIFPIYKPAKLDYFYLNLLPASEQLPLLHFPRLQGALSV
jgi:hypothetical protein